MNKPLVVIFTAICLDAVGIGLIFPILPRLLEDVTHTQNIAPYIGIITALYAAMQFISFLPGPATKLFGERWAVLVGVACACIALVALAFANQGWIVFAIMPIFALTGIGTPALQSLATRQVDPARQGQFQGVLASAVSLASIVAPLAFSTFYFVVQKEWPGAIWLSVVVIYAIAVPLVYFGTRTAPATQPASA